MKTTQLSQYYPSQTGNPDWCWDKNGETIIVLAYDKDGRCVGRNLKKPDGWTLRQRSQPREGSVPDDWRKIPGFWRELVEVLVGPRITEKGLLRKFLQAENKLIKESHRSKED